MGRRRKGRSVEMKLLIPEMIYLEFEKELTNNFANKPVYGARSQLVTALIKRWIEAKQQARAASQSEPESAVNDQKQET